LKTIVSSRAALLFVVLGSIQALFGQTPVPSQRIVSKSEYVAGPSQNKSAPFSNRAGNSKKRLAPKPDASEQPAVTFLSAKQIATGGAATYPTVGGDLNGDSFPDVVTLIQNSASPTGIYLAVLLNNGLGTLSAPILTPVSFGPKDLIIVADVNNDGNADVALIHPNSMDVLIAMGNGTFAAPQNLPTGITSPIAASFWDVNHNEVLDVVVVDGQSTQAAYLLGDGSGGFGPPQITSFPAQVSVAVLADVDDDSNLDLVTNNALYPGDGNGGFSAGIAFQSNDEQNAGALSSNSVAVGDLNGDGFLDVVTANGDWNTVSVFLNQGGRALSQDGASFWSGNQPVALAIADVNWDGKLDLVVTNAAESDLSVFLGTGSGTFLTPTTEYAIGGSPSNRPVLADFNGDGDLDVVISDNQSSVVMALGFGDGTFQAAPVNNIVVPPGSNNSGGALSIASADFNGDGIADFIVGQSSTSPGLGLVAFLTESNGSLGKGVVYAQNDALSYVAVGDLGQNGRSDIVASNWATGAVEVLRGNGNGTFQAPTAISLPGITNGLVIADLNGDGWPDVAVAGKDPVVYVLLNDGKGSLALAGAYPISAAGYELVAADLNNDGKLDLAIAMTSTSRVAILLGNGSGSFSSAPDYNTTMSSVYGIAAGDLTGNGNLDLVVTSPTDGSIAVALGHGDGSFSAPSIYPASLLLSQKNPSPGEVALSDANKDGKLDVVYANSGHSSVGVLLGDGAGSFSGPSEFPTGGGSLAVAIADLNKDSWPDIVTADVHFSGISVLYNTTSPQSAPDFSIAANPGAVNLPLAGTVTTAISLLSGNAFVGSVQLACENLPPALLCSFQPSALHLHEGQSVSSQLTIGFAQSKVRKRVLAALGSGEKVMLLSMLPMLGGIFCWGRQRALSKAALLVLLASLMLLIGCQGLAPAPSSTQPPPPPPPVIYSFTVVGTAWNGTSHSVPMQVTVQP
jgi:hypothetical protein